MLAAVPLDREDEPDDDEPDRRYKWKCPRCGRWVFEPLKRTCRACQAAMGPRTGLARD